MSWGYVQGKFGSGTGSQASLTVTPASAFNVGDLVIASYSLYSNTTATVGDASGGINTWTQLTRELASGAVCGMAWTVVQSGGTSLGVKLTPGSNNYMSMQVDEYSITGSAITFGNTAGTTGSAGTAMSGNLTFASSGSFLLHSAFTQSNVTATWTGGTGWTVNVANVGGRRLRSPPNAISGRTQFGGITGQPVLHHKSCLGRNRRLLSGNHRRLVARVVGVLSGSCDRIPESHERLLPRLAVRPVSGSV